MARIGIYLPKFSRPEGEDKLTPISDSIMRKETLKLAETLTELCGGCTSIEVTGYYRFPDGFFSEAPTVEMYCFCADEEAGNVAKVLKPMLLDIKLRLAQNYLGMYVNEKFVQM